MAIHGWSMDKSYETIGNTISNTLTFMDYMGLSMAASDNPLIFFHMMNIDVPAGVGAPPLGTQLLT